MAILIFLQVVGCVVGRIHRVNWVLGVRLSPVVDTSCQLRRYRERQVR